MVAPGHAPMLDEQIALWRSYLGRRQASQSLDVAELESHLRMQIARLTAAGLAADEAFVIAVKRMGDLDARSREFAHEHSSRLWKQLIGHPSGMREAQAARADTVIAFGLTAAAVMFVKLPELFGLSLYEDFDFYVRNWSFFVLPLLTGYFAWKRRLDARSIGWLAAAFVVAAILVNAYPFTPSGHTGTLAALHLPVALWMAVGIAYAGSRWNQMEGRMDFIRFSGELFIYGILIALGISVFSVLMATMFQAVGIDLEIFFETWLLPCGAVGVVVISAWLVEGKQAVIENMAPVLAHLFTPLFAALLVVFLGTLLWTGRGINIERDVLIGFDLLLVIVLGLLLYSISARESHKPPGLFDVMQVVLVVSALAADAVTLWAIAARITEFGFSPNRVAALGENVVLLVNLTGSAVLYIRFLRGQGSFTDLERWQTKYLPAFAVWAAAVVIAFPPLFGFI